MEVFRIRYRLVPGLSVERSGSGLNDFRGILKTSWMIVKKRKINLLEEINRETFEILTMLEILVTTIYLYLGSLHWETRLVAQFGDEYREYQKRVHRIIPKLRGYR